MSYDINVLILPSIPADREWSFISS